MEPVTTPLVDQTKNINSEFSLYLDMKEMITEYEMWGLYDYFKDVGSYLAMIFLWVLVFFGMIGSIFISSFIQ